MAHVSDAKKKAVEELVALIKEYPIIGAVNMANLPTKTVQKMREQLRDKVVIKMTKRRLIKIALEQTQVAKKGIEKLDPFLKGMPALLFTKENPFILFKTLEKNKSTAPIKAGQVAPKEIIVPAGPTGFAPGPIIGELGGLGISAGIDAGKVAIKKDSSVAKEGAVVSQALAGVLTRLGIEPMEIGLDLTATYEDGNIFTKDVLAVDEQEYIDNITQGHRWAFNIAVDAGVLNTETTEFMIVKAFQDSKGLAVSENILNDATVDQILAKAEAHAASVKSEAKL